jgi:hypothetical protein
MRPRKLELASGTWRFLVDSHDVTLWSPSGKRHRVRKEELPGVAPHFCQQYERPEPCLGPIGPVTPGMLRAYIEARLDEESRS